MPKNKQLQFLEDAEKLYVEQGLETITIEGVLKSAVSRRALDNWKVQYNWDKKRENFNSRNDDIKGSVHDLLVIARDQAKLDPSDKNIKKFERLIFLALKLGIGINLGDDINKKSTKISPETIEMIEKEILGI